MTRAMTRREMVKSGAAMAGVAMAGVATVRATPLWAGMPAAGRASAGPGQEEVVPFADQPDDFVTQPSDIVRFVDIRRIDDFYTPADEFFTIQHYGQPEVDATAHELQISGLVSRPQRLTMADIRRRPRVELACAYECSGNSRRRFDGLVSNGLWGGTSLKDLLTDIGLEPGGREVVFFGADRGNETITVRGTSWDVEQQFARSLAVDDALRDDVILAYELNGDPLTLDQGSPLRLIVPGWYGVAQVKWLEQIHVQEDRFMGKFMAREYVTLRDEEVGDDVKATETSITRMKLKSVINKVTRSPGHHTVHGFVLNDGTPLDRVEVRVDDGPWMRAELDPRNTRYSWKMFAYRWENPSAGEHTLTARAIDANGVVQPTVADLERKKTSWENNAQFPRSVIVS